MRVEVTAGMIAGGKRYDGFRCPVAVAASEATGRQASADRTLIGLRRPDGYYDYVRTPLAAKRFMEAFDAGEAVEPFAFDLEAP